MASIGYVEARSALGRAARDGTLGRRLVARTTRDLAALWHELTVLELDAELVSYAGDIADHRGLRAGDAIHLAAALRLNEPDLLFATWDRALQRAAIDSGLAVTP